MTWRSLLLAGAALTLAAILALPQAHSQQAAGPKPAANALGAEMRHIHIWVMDIARTKAFYRDKLGFRVTNETPTVVEFPGLWFGKWRGQGAIPTGGITIGIAAESVDAMYNELKKRGVDIPKPPAPMRNEFSFMFKDPDGYEIEVEGPK
ncbi:MAG: VOC family protein [Acidobacteria bacterium]|nr:VOC family protein [Acidobacteriota bacterium]